VRWPRVGLRGVGDTVDGSGPLLGPEWGLPALRKRDMSVQLSGWMAAEATALLERG
jgi:hypothetical protein